MSSRMTFRRSSLGRLYRPIHIHCTGDWYPAVNFPGCRIVGFYPLSTFAGDKLTPDEQ